MNIQRKNLQPGIVVLEISDKISMGPDCLRLTREVEELLAANSCRLIFDLSGVHHLDSAAVGKIVECLAKVKKSGGDLRVAGAKGMVAEVFRITNVEKLVGQFPTAAAAAENFGSRTTGGPQN